MEKKRILFVDDEPSLRMTLPAILERHGYEVVAAATVPEALEIMQHDPFDVLLSDLNIGQPGDGFTLVSAMRRVQPRAVTFILTGFPDFDKALSAIRNQVDGFIVKPADLTDLVTQLQEKLASDKGPMLPPSIMRVSQIIREHEEKIISDWLKLVDGEPDIARIPLTRQERMDHIPKVVKELSERVDEARDDHSERAIDAAEVHGQARFAQGYSIPQIMVESRLLQRVLSNTIHLHLLELDISTVIVDVIRVGESSASLVEEAVRSYQEAERRDLMRHKGKRRATK